MAAEDCNPIVGSAFLAGTGLEPLAGGVLPFTSFNEPVAGCFINWGADGGTATGNGGGVVMVPYLA